MERTKWRVYARLEPFGPWRDDIRSGMAAAQIVNTLRLGFQSKVNPGFTKPSDFVLDFMAPPAPPPKPQSIEDQKLILQAICQAHEKRKARKHGR